MSTVHNGGARQYLPADMQFSKALYINLTWAEWENKILFPAQQMCLGKLLHPIYPPPPPSDQVGRA